MAKKKKVSKKKVSKKKVNKLIKILPLPILIIVVGIVVVIYLFQSGIISFQKKEINNNPNTTTTVPATTDLPITTGIIPTTTNTVPTTTTSHEEGKIYEDIFYNQFEIHFLELGSTDAGDSVFIKAGDNDILIDAGSVQASATTIETYVDKYCKDGKLEYVITTHAHTDHIAGMLGNTSTNTSKYPNKKGEKVEFNNKDGQPISANGILSYYDIDTIIDFGNRNNSTAAIVQNYKCAVNYAVSKGAKHYSAEECFNNENGAKRTYSLGENMSFDILYNYYYFNSAEDENDYSVCTMFNYKDYHFMLTGDLELEGETKLANYYDGSTEEKTLPHCVLFKGGHHGSSTSSNEVLLSKITPEICCVCCCAGTAQYTNRVDNQFPYQAFIDRIAKYTSRVYVTSMINSSNSLTSMNGNMIISSNGLNIGIKGSKNTTKLKDTTWFNEDIYVLKDSKGYDINCSGAGKTDWYTSATEGATVRKRRTWPDYGKE